MRQGDAAGYQANVVEARTTALAFYGACGYVEESEDYLKHGLPHRMMRKSLNGKTPDMRTAYRKGHAIELAALGAFAGGSALCALEWGWLKSVLAGFSLASILYVVTIAIVLQRAREGDLPGLAARHDQRAVFVLFVGLVLDFAAMGLVVLFLTTLKMDGVAVALAALSILSAWILLNTLFAIHYAHIYFSAGAREITTLSFPGDGRRVFSDFLYFSFVIGMTFQVSDVAIADARLRRLVLAHSILAFLFNVFVIALAVNAVGSFL